MAKAAVVCSAVMVASAAPVKFIPGVKPEAMAMRAEFAKNAPKDLTSIDIPADFDSEANWPKCKDVIGDIRDQSNCGCCWAFAAASAASDRLCIATDGTVTAPISANDVCFCASPDGCDGGDIQTPWEHIKNGAVTGGQYQDKEGYCSAWPFGHCHHHGPQRDDPYPAEGQPGCPHRESPECPRKCDSTATAGHKQFSDDKWSFEGEIVTVSGANGIAEEVMKGGPVETAFTVYEDFADYSGGIYEHKSGGELGGHAVRIVGFGTENGKKYWKVANSWNPYWGEKGYFRIVRGTNNCGIEDMVTASSRNAKWSQAGLEPSNDLKCSGCETAVNFIIGKGVAGCATACTAAGTALGPFAPIFGAACGEICHLIESGICGRVKGGCPEKVCQEVHLCPTDSNISSVVV